MIKKLHFDDIPWVEKYRPRKINDIVQQDEIVKILNDTIKTGNLPHLLLYGPPGTGKTSTILAVAHQLFGPKVIGDRVIELNASDDRGINIVRDKIIKFAKHAIGSKDPIYPCPDINIVILDEADAMTPEAQAALRKVMEKMSRITRFVLICNYESQIIDPIVSRCMKFRFKPISNKCISDKLRFIASNENMEINDECIDTIVDISEGDARMAIMSLQNLKYITNYKKHVSSKDIIQITGGIDKNEFKDFWKICGENINNVRNLARTINKNGYPIKAILAYLNECNLNSELNDLQKSKIAIEICNTDRRLLGNADQYLQILNILIFINKICKA